MNSELETLKTRQQELTDKFINGEKLTRKERLEMQEIARKIKEIEQESTISKSDSETPNAINTLKNLLNALKTKDTLTEEEEKQIVNLTTQINNELVENAGISNVANVIDLNKKRIDLLRLREKKIVQKAEIELLGDDTTEVDNYLTRINELLNEIGKLQKQLLDSEYIIDMFSEDIPEDKKKEQIENIIAKLNEYEKNSEIIDNDLKTKTKSKLAAITEFYKKHKKESKIAGVCSALILTITLAVALQSCSHNKENIKKDNEPISNTEIEFQEENPNRKKINALTAKGYDEFTASLMMKNFNDKTIEELLNGPYIEAVTKYATVSDFNLDYIIDYETALNTFDLAPEKAVDYVNRAYEINKTNFYDGATINEIVEVVMAIDKKDIFKSDNAALDNSINNTISYAVIDFNDNRGTNEMVAKMGALPYFAKKGSDLEAFLKEYSTILQSIIKNASNETELHAAQTRMYTYLYAFANAHNGYVEKGSDIVVNENAIVKDTFDWYIAYESFVKPAMSMFINNENVNDFVCLQETMLGIVNQEPYVQYCQEESLTLGGE